MQKGEEKKSKIAKGSFPIAYAKQFTKHPKLRRNCEGIKTNIRA